MNTLALIADRVIDGKSVKLPGDTSQLRGVLA